jgi:ribosomal protein L37AE/L43A
LHPENKKCHNKTKEATMTKVASLRTFHDMNCEECGEGLIAPEWSEYVSEQLVMNIWSCPSCGNQFETEAQMPAGTKATTIAISNFFPSLLVA